MPVLSQTIQYSFVSWPRSPCFSSVQRKTLLAGYPHPMIYSRDFSAKAYDFRGICVCPVEVERRTTEGKCPLVCGVWIQWREMTPPIAQLVPQQSEGLVQIDLTPRKPAPKPAWLK